MLHKFKHSALAALLLLAVGGCKKDSIAPATDAETTFVRQAKQFVQQKIPQADYIKLDWGSAIAYQEKGANKMLKVPLRGNTSPGQKSIYLTCDKGSFTGNYFELMNNTIVTISLDNVRKCIAPLTTKGQIDEYKIYENGQLVSLRVDAKAAVVVRPPTQFWGFNFTLYCLVQAVGFGQGVGGEMSSTPEGTYGYLETQGGGSGSQGTIVYINYPYGLEYDWPLDVLWNNVYEYLDSQLNLNEAQFNWLVQHWTRAKEIFDYLYNGYTVEKMQGIIRHINAMMEDAAYMDFVQQHQISGNTNIMWFEDNNWLYDNMNMDFEYDPVTGAPPEDLTAAEKVLIIQYKYEAYLIFRNGKNALAETKVRFPGSQMLNDKADAFRHTYWLACNTKSVGANLAYMFGLAHESETPLKFNLEQRMDLHNNNVGILLYQSGFTNAQLATAAMAAVVDGSCWYLNPINYNDSCFRGCSANPGGTHGITQQTKITPTNQ